MDVTSIIFFKYPVLIDILILNQYVLIIIRTIYDITNLNKRIEWPTFWSLIFDEHKMLYPSE